MESFDQRGGLDDRLGAHRTEAIPPELTWEQMGPAIRDGVANRKRRRRPWVYWLALLAGIGLALWWRLPGPTEFRLDAFPLPRAVASPVIAQSPHYRRAPAVPSPAGTLPMAGPDLIGTGSAETPTGGPSTEPVADLASATIDPPEPSAVPQPIPPVPSQSSTFSGLAEHEKPLPQQSTAGVIPLPASRLTAVTTAERSPPLPPLSSPDRFGAAPGPWRIALSGGINTADWNYTVPADTDLDPAAYQEALPGWQASLRIERRWRGPWSFGTGVQVQRLRYRSAFTTAERTNLYQPGTIDTIFVSPATGTETYRYRDSLPGVRIRRFQHHNYRTSWRVPLYLAYTWRRTDFTVGLAAGVHLELGRQHTGRIALAPDRVSELPGVAAARSTWRGSTWLEARLAVPLTPRIALQTRFGYDRYWQDQALPTAPISQRPAALYGTVGVSWSPW